MFSLPSYLAIAENELDLMLLEHVNSLLTFIIITLKVKQKIICE